MAVASKARGRPAETPPARRPRPGRRLPSCGGRPPERRRRGQAYEGGNGVLVALGARARPARPRRGCAEPGEEPRLRGAGGRNCVSGSAPAGKPRRTYRRESAAVAHPTRESSLDLLAAARPSGSARSPCGSSRRARHRPREPAPNFCATARGSRLRPAAAAMTAVVQGAPRIHAAPSSAPQDLVGVRLEDRAYLALLHRRRGRAHGRSRSNMCAARGPDAAPPGPSAAPSSRPARRPDTARMPIRGRDENGSCESSGCSWNAPVLQAHW